MKCSELSAQIQAHIARYGDGEVVMSGDRRAPEMHPEGADLLVIDQRVKEEWITEDDDV